ncbi:DNA-binding response OmpR family regulator [Virgibacillus halotolerans]|uniref:response regulator n=1 Tax=Virgibacillus halotolerans TaxID=1071053 RepID=UPI00196125D7|nr:response regulator [Virgibacillus halotolerans]MBM7601197.1 DNA-binding response OmpR family regulator [Virgibacillus halotolerans]
MVKEILIVDDQLGIRTLLSDILTNEGYGVSTAGTGKEALDKALANYYDLIILDYKLPFFNGVEVLQQLQQNQIEIPAILISGLINDEVKKTSAGLIQKVMAKPFNVKDIQQSVKLILADREV